MLIATDGSCSANGAPGAKAGFGVACENGKRISGPVKAFNVKEIQYPEAIYYPSRQLPSNNRGELMGILYALHYLSTQPAGNHIIITDSTYCKNIFTGWYDKWIAEGTFSSKKNQDIITLIIIILNVVTGTGHTVEFVWQKAHLPASVDKTTYSRLNDIADKLADEGRTSASITMN